MIFFLILLLIYFLLCCALNWFGKVPYLLIFMISLPAFTSVLLLKEIKNKQYVPHIFKPIQIKID